MSKKARTLAVLGVTNDTVSLRRHIVEATPARVGSVLGLDVGTMDALCRDADNITSCRLIVED